MSVNQTNNFTKAWVVSDAQATVDAFLALPDRLVAETTIGSLGQVQVSLEGSAMGVQVQGDAATVNKDVAGLADKSFSVASLTAQLRDKSNVPLQITFNIAQRLMTAGVKNTDPSTARMVFEVLLRLFPESTGVSQAELSSKSNRLEAFIREAESLKVTVGELRLESKAVADLTAKAKSAADGAVASAAEAGKAKQESITQKAEILSSRQEAQRFLGEITAVKTQVEGLQSATQQLHQGTTSMEAKVRDFFNKVDEHIRKLKTAEEATSSITTVNTDLQSQIKEQLIKAVGVGLFGAFDRRKGQIVTSKWIWAGLSVVATLIQVGVVVWLAAEAKELGVATDAVKMLSPLFLLKATAAIPVFFLIWFCVSEYSHERRHEETYAFKTALSFSLAPYLDLVKKISDQKDAEKYRDFVVSTVSQVFTDPTHDDGKKVAPTQKVLADVEQLLESIGKFAEKVRGR